MLATFIYICMFHTTSVPVRGLEVEAPTKRDSQGRSRTQSNICDGAFFQKLIFNC